MGFFLNKVSELKKTVSKIKKVEDELKSLNSYRMGLYCDIVNAFLSRSDIEFYYDGRVLKNLRVNSYYTGKAQYGDILDFDIDCNKVKMSTGQDFYRYCRELYNKAAELAKKEAFEKEITDLAESLYPQVLFIEGKSVLDYLKSYTLDQLRAIVEKKTYQQRDNALKAHSNFTYLRSDTADRLRSELIVINHYINKLSSGESQA